MSFAKNVQTIFSKPQTLIYLAEIQQQDIIIRIYIVIFPSTLLRYDLNDP